MVAGSTILQYASKRKYRLETTLPVGSTEYYSLYARGASCCASAVSQLVLMWQHVVAGTAPLGQALLRQGDFPNPSFKTSRPFMFLRTCTLMQKCGQV